MDTKQPQPAQKDDSVELRLEQLNKRLDKAVERFAEMRKDYRFLAGPNWRDSNR